MKHPKKSKPVFKNIDDELRSSERGRIDKILKSFILSEQEQYELFGGKKVKKQKWKMRQEEARAASLMKAERA